MDLPGSKIPTKDMICPFAMHMGSVPQGNNRREDEFDFLEIANILLKKKNFILAIALIAGIVGLVYGISLPNIYKSEVLVIPNKRIGNSGGGGVSPLVDQFGGLASAFGISLGGRPGRQENESDVYLAIMRTRPFAEYTIKEFNLMPMLAIQINKENPAAVTREDAVNMFLDDMKIVKANKELESALRISFSGKSPELSARIVETLVKSINKYSQYDTIERAKRDIAMTNAQLQQAPLVMIQKSLWDIVSQKTIEIVLAQAQDDFSFRIIEPAVIPKEKYKPHRGLIVVGFTFIGFLIGILAVLLRAQPSLQKKSS